MPQPSPRARDNSGYLSEDTIAAIATAVGGPIAIVRISGPRAFAVLALLTGSPAHAGAEPRRLTRARILDLAQPETPAIDDALFVRFVAPESYTGEDSVELHLHGGGFILAKTLELLLACGVRQALPGEFSFRAIRNGKLTLTQAHAVADLIAASNEGALKMALEKMSGSQSRLLLGIAEPLRELAALSELGIDFADQDVEEVSLRRLKERLIPLLQALERLRETFDRGRRIQDGVRVAFIGLPNAGKSSFFNALLGEDRSIVSELAGTTRDVVRERLSLRGNSSTVTLRLEDTAGLRHASDSVERQGIERSEKSAKEADLILLVVDPNEPVAAVQEQWLRLQPWAAEKTLGVITKIDLVSASALAETKSRLAPLGIARWTETSAVAGTGIKAAAQAIADACEQGSLRGKDEVLLTRQDQLLAVSSAVESLVRAQEVDETDLFASDIRQALVSLELLIGQTLPDDILGRIFSEFCIGK